jgi:hypothetical protein
MTRGYKYSLELLMMSGVPLEKCSVFNKLWNNKFYYKAAFCWYFYRAKISSCFCFRMIRYECCEGYQQVAGQQGCAGGIALYDVCFS